MRMSDWSSDVCSSDLIDEDDVEFGLLFSGRCSSGSSRASNGNSSGGGSAPLLFQSLGQFRGFQNGQFGKLVNESVNVCHVNILHIDRKSVVSGESVSVRVDIGGRRIIEQKKNT